MTAAAGRVRIIEYTPAHHEAFRSLNLEWITTYFDVEAGDRQVLDDPQRHILDPGGAIVMATVDGAVVGTCALVKHSDQVYELAKMAVSPAAQGYGAGRALGVAVIERARALGGTRIELLSNRSLAPALGLYASLGFVEVPLSSTRYVRANIKMVLDLHPQGRTPMLDVILKRFETPDETRTFERGRFELVRLGGMTIGRATYEPGWRWSAHVGPTAGTPSCQVEHVGMVLTGRAVAAMDDGRIIEMRPGDIFYIAPGHDSWVVGDEPYVSLHFLGADAYGH